MHVIDSTRAESAPADKTVNDDAGKYLSDRARKVIETPVEKAISGKIVIGLVQCAETVLMFSTGVIAWFAYAPTTDIRYYAALSFYGAMLFLTGQNLANNHSIQAYRTSLQQSGRGLFVWATVVMMLLTGLFLLKLSDYFSRAWILIWLVAGFIVFVIFRIMLRLLILKLTKGGHLKRRTALVGGGSEAEDLIRLITRSADNDIELFGLFDDREDHRSPDLVADCPKLGSVADLVELARLTRIDLVIVSLPISAESRVLHMLRQLWVLPVDIRLSAHMSKLKFKSRAYSFLGEVPVFEIADKPISGWNVVAKWGFDQVFAVLALIIFSPIMILTAIAIKLESAGPVIFKQKRLGFNNEPIEILKFRSMYTHMSDPGADRLVTRNDKRVTRVGRIIRRTSIDELPQFFNVLRGDLSICGPRPHAMQARAEDRLYHDIVDGYFARHRVKPGVTGWAQINGWRGETDTHEKILNRVNHDLYYIENWSILFDLYIVLMTPVSLVNNSDGAY